MEPSADETLGGRVFLAINEIERRHGRRLTDAEVGALVAATEDPPRVDTKGKPYPYSAGHVNRWKKNKKRPTLDAIAALSKLSGLRGGWLAFHEAPKYEPQHQANPQPQPSAIPHGAKPTRKAAVHPLPVEPLSPVRATRKPAATEHRAPNHRARPKKAR